eukprot:5647632-Prymnesium_polylepis.2
MQTLVRRSERMSSRKKAEPQAKTDETYAALLGLRSVPFADFLCETTSNLEIASVNEAVPQGLEPRVDRLLKQLGLPSAERASIEGLRTGGTEMDTVRGSRPKTEEQLAAMVLARLAHDPPMRVGAMQRHTAQKLLRPFPLG